MRQSTVVSRSPDDTEQAGEALARRLRPGDVVLLSGPLGSGKTVLVRGMARGLGVREPVTSPSFVIVSEYDAQPRLCHVDLYRLNTREELENLGLRDLLPPAGIAVVEWGEKASDLLPPQSIRVSIELGEGGTRLISIAEGS